MKRAEPAWFGSLVSRLAGEQPGTALLLGAPDDDRLKRLRAALIRSEVTELNPDAGYPPDATRYSVAVIAGALETLPADRARELIAQLRDIAAEHTLVCVNLQRSPLPEVEFRSLGFRLHARDGDEALFGFDLYDYKDRPEWLNARYWAHPELWDKYRW